MGIYGSIYGLYDPSTGELRYIGQTTIPLRRRLAAHMTPSSLSHPEYRAYWISSILRQGLRPIIKEIATASSREELDRLEVEHIALARLGQVRLVNIEPGGNSLSPEHYTRLAEMKRGIPRTPEVRAKISAAKKGKPSSKRGPMSEEQKVKVSASRKGKLLGATHHQYRGDISTDFILQRIAEGRTKVQVAEELGVSSTLIHRRLNQAGLTGESRPKGKREAWNKGKAHSAEHVANFAASRKGKATGTDHHFYRHDILDEDLRQKVQEGLTPSQIAKYYGVARITVARRLRKVA